MLDNRIKPLSDIKKPPKLNLPADEVLTNQKEDLPRSHAHVDFT